MEKLIFAGAYAPDVGPDTDAAICFSDPLETFLNKRKHEHMSADHTFAEEYRLLGDAGINVPLGAPSASHPASGLPQVTAPRGQAAGVRTGFPSSSA